MTQGPQVIEPFAPPDPMALAEWVRSRLLVRVGIRLDKVLSTRVFNASFDAYLNESSSHPSRAFSDLIQIRQFLTGPGVSTRVNAARSLA